MAIVNLSNIFHQATRDALIALAKAATNQVAVHGGLGVATTPAQFKLTAATNYMIGGVNYTKAATQNIATPVTTTTAGQYAKDLISINAAGTVTVTGGVIAASAAAAELPDVPEGSIALGYIAVPPSFVPGTTSVTADMLISVTHGVVVMDNAVAT